MPGGLKRACLHCLETGSCCSVWGSLLQGRGNGIGLSHDPVDDLLHGGDVMDAADHFAAGEDAALGVAAVVALLLALAADVGEDIVQRGVAVLFQLCHLEGGLILQVPVGEVDGPLDHHGGKLVAVHQQLLEVGGDGALLGGHDRVPMTTPWAPRARMAR